MKVKRKSSKADINIKNIKVNVPAAAVIAVIIIAVIVSAVVVAGNKQSEGHELYSFGKDTAHGIDVSEHNGKIDWQKVAQTQDFAFIRVGYRGYGNGEIVEDRYAKENLKGAQEAGIPFGVYFYTQSVDEKEAKEEADFVYHIIKKYDVELPVIIDFEFPVDSDGNAVGRVAEADNEKEKNTAIINAFIKKMQDRGYASGVYASSSMLSREIDVNKLKKDSFIWAADYNDRVTYDVDYNAWQYTETGECEGIGSKYVDMNYWYAD